MSENSSWERQALEHLLLENLKEQRRARRWRAVFRVLSLVIVIGVASQVFDWNWGGKSALGKHTALVDLQSV